MQRFTTTQAALASAVPSFPRNKDYSAGKFDQYVADNRRYLAMRHSALGNMERLLATDTSDAQPTAVQVLDVP